MGLYMLSSGSYSDYCVGGLYESDMVINEDSLKKLRADYAEALGMPRSIVDNDSSIDDYILERHYKSFVVGRGEPEHPLINASKKELSNYYSESAQFRADYEKSGGAIEINFIKWLVSQGVLIEVQYTEVWRD